MGYHHQTITSTRTGYALQVLTPPHKPPLRSGLFTPIRHPLCCKIKPGFYLPAWWYWKANLLSWLKALHSLSLKIHSAFWWYNLFYFLQHILHYHLNGILLTPFSKGDYGGLSRLVSSPAGDNFKCTLFKCIIFLIFFNCRYHNTFCIHFCCLVKSFLTKVM